MNPEAAVVAEETGMPVQTPAILCQKLDGSWISTSSQYWWYATFALGVHKGHAMLAVQW